MKAAPLLLVLLLATPAAAQPRPDVQTLVAPVATPFLGGVPTGTATREVVTITVLDAIVRALEHNLGVLLAEQDVGRAHGIRWRMLSELLPNVNGRISETRQKINLQAFGFGSAAGGPSFPASPTSSARSTSSTPASSCRSRWSTLRR